MSEFLESDLARRSVGRVSRFVFNEEWEHLRHGERDLTALENER